MNKRAELLYLKDILDAVIQIEKYTKTLSEQQFSKDQMVLDAVVRNLEIIGEAAAHIKKQTKSAYPHIPWTEMKGMRNKVIHEYFGVDTDIIWKTVHSLPGLKKDLKKVLKDIR